MGWFIKENDLQVWYKKDSTYDFGTSMWIVNPQDMEVGKVYGGGEFRQLCLTAKPITVFSINQGKPVHVMVGLWEFNKNNL